MATGDVAGTPTGPIAEAARVAEPSVSVIIPSYNRAALLPRAIRSALDAIDPGDEVIVVDDGSIDHTATTMRPFGDRVRFLRTAHRGAGWARNKGIAAAHGTLVAFLDSDDEWMPDKLQLQRTLMRQRPDVLFSFSDFVGRTADRADQHHGLERWRDDPRDWVGILGPGTCYSDTAPLPPGRDDFAVHVGDIYPELLHHDLVPTFTLVVRRSVAGDALHFADDLPTYEDLECHTRLARAGAAAYLDCETAWQWGHAGPRLSKVDPCTWATARLAVLDRVYRQDAGYMADHAQEVNHACSQQHLQRARWFISHGDNRQARHELRQAGGGPLNDQVLAHVPRWCHPWLRRVGRCTRGGARAVQHWASPRLSRGRAAAHHIWCKSDYVR